MYIKLHGKIYKETNPIHMSGEELLDFAKGTKTSEGKLKVRKIGEKIYILCDVKHMGREYLIKALEDIIAQTDKELDEERMKSNMGTKELFKQIQKEAVQPVITPGKPWDINRDDMFKWDPNRNPVWCTTTKLCDSVPTTMTCSNNQDVLVIDMSAHMLPENPCIPSCWLADTYTKNQADTQNFLNKTIR